MSDIRRVRLDELRRFAAALGAGVGLAPPQAMQFASHLLWFDAAGAGQFGMSTLHDWLERIDQGEIDPKSEGKIGHEHAGTTVLHAENGLAPLLLRRAAGLATEKARDVGVGLVRVTGLGHADSTAPIVADLAIGPLMGLSLGPGSAWAIALPSSEGLPLVYDASLVPTSSKKRKIPTVPTPWTLLLSEGDWLIQAVAIAALESLASLHQRLDKFQAMEPSRNSDSPGLLQPHLWDRHRRLVREHGVPLSHQTWSELSTWSSRLKISLPAASELSTESRSPS